MITVCDVYNYLDKIAPFNNQDKTDNASLLVGNYNEKINRIIACLSNYYQKTLDK